VNEPIVLSSTYHADAPLAYGREGNQTWAALEATVTDLEHGAGAVAFGSGLAAIGAVLDLVPAGGIVVAPSHPYSGTRARLKELAASGRLHVREYSPGPTADISSELVGADLLWIETPTNPLLEISDIADLCRQASTAGARTAVDSTFATPMYAQPLTQGADFSIHSATKYLSGHSDVLMGLAIGATDDLVAALQQRRTLLGAVPGPFEAWLTLRGIRTLAVRMDRAVANASSIAAALHDHPDVNAVLYPGLPTHVGHALAMATSGPGAIVSFIVDDADRADAICRATHLWTNGTSLGGVESLIERRARLTQEHPDVPPGLIRLSVGIEDVADLWNDLADALASTQRAN